MPTSIDFASFSSLSDVQAELRRVQAEEARLDAELCSMLSQEEPGSGCAAPLAATIAAAAGATTSADALADVAAIDAGVAELLASVEGSGTKVNAARMSERLRTLHIASGRVGEVLNRVSTVLDLKDCVAGMTAAMGGGGSSSMDLAAATEHVRGFKTARALLAPNDADVLAMAAAEQELKTKVDAAYALCAGGGEGAGAEMDLAGVMHHTRLLASLHGPTAAAERFFGSLTTALQKELKAAASAAASFVELSGAVLNAVAAAIQRSEAFVGAYFAAVGGPSRLVAQLGALGGAEVAAVLRKFEAENALAERQRRLEASPGGEQHGLSGEAGGAAAADAELLELDGLLDDVALMCQYSESFRRFAESQAAQAAQYEDQELEALRGEAEAAREAAAGNGGLVLALDGGVKDAGSAAGAMEAADRAEAAAAAVVAATAAIEAARGGGGSSATAVVQPGGPELAAAAASLGDRFCALQRGLAQFSIEKVGLAAESSCC